MRVRKTTAPIVCVRALSSFSAMKREASQRVFELSVMCLSKYQCVGQWFDKFTILATPDEEKNRSTFPLRLASSSFTRSVADDIHGPPFAIEKSDDVVRVAPQLSICTQINTPCRTQEIATMSVLFDTAIVGDSVGEKNATFGRNFRRRLTRKCT